METISDLLQEISDSRNGKGYSFIENLLNDIIENCDYDLSIIELKYHCSISVTKEKHNALQFTYYYSISCELISCELNLEIESGINNGTQLNAYSFVSCLVPESRTIEVLKDIVLDEERYKNSGFSLPKAKAVFPRYKEKILKLIKDRSYDNYVTGGGTNKTNTYYRSELDKIRDFGIFWEAIYEDVECDLNLV